MQNLHPAFQQALSGFAPPSPLTEYHKALSRFDWQYQFSDDPMVYARGAQSLIELHKMQMELDPTGEIWNSYPGSQGHGAPFPRITEGV